MKKAITTLTLAAAMLLAAPATAFATHVDDEKNHGFDKSKDKAGFVEPGSEVDCRPGPQGHSLVGSWTQYRMEDYIAELTARLDARLLSGELTMTDEEYAARIRAYHEAAEATWTFCDKNRDGFLCVLTTEPSPYYYTLLDNRPFPG